MIRNLTRGLIGVGIMAVAVVATQTAKAADQNAQAPKTTVKSVEGQIKKDNFGGKIASIDVTAGTITIKHKEETKTFALAPDCKFGGDAGAKKAKLADLQVGDRVKVSYTEEGGKLLCHHIGHIDLTDAKPKQPEVKKTTNQ